MPIPSNAKPILRPSLRDEVYTTLLDWIVEGTLQPGEKIRDVELAEHLGVSRTPVREALRRLEDKNLVHTAPGRWTRVNDVSLQEANKIYPVIVRLEQLALESAFAHISKDLLSEMNRTNTLLKQALIENDPVLATSLDTEFHRLFTDAADNSYLSEILADLKLKHRRFEIACFSRRINAVDSVEEHEQIIAAIRNNDLETASRLIRSNWQHFFETTDIERMSESQHQKLMLKG